MEKQKIKQNECQSRLAGKKMIRHWPLEQISTQEVLQIELKVGWTGR